MVLDKSSHLVGIVVFSIDQDSRRFLFPVEVPHSFFFDCESGFFLLLFLFSFPFDQIQAARAHVLLTDQAVDSDEFLDQIKL